MPASSPSPTARPEHTQRVLRMLVAALLVACVGCSPYKMVGDQVMKFGERQIMPYALASNELNTACHAAKAFTQATASFQRVGTDIDRMAVLLLTADGVCAEGDAFDAEMHYLRAMHQHNYDEATDARITQKRFHELAARRQLDAWKHFVAAFGEPREGHCPKLKTEFDQLVFLVGIISGVQAVLNDAQAEQAAKVSRDIAPLAAHMADCLDNDRWWGMPLAIRASMWNILPASAPEGVEPMKIIEQVAHDGGKRGVRLGHVAWVMAAYTDGNAALTKTVIRDFVRSSAEQPADPRYRLLDAIAGSVMLSISDRVWTEAAGTRTPMGALGTFPDDPPKVDPDISDLLSP